MISEHKDNKYTGENRCIKCTIVNVIIAIVLSMVIYTISPIVAIGVLLASFIAIYFKGYLVPGTPKATKTYFPNSVLSIFNKNKDRIYEDMWTAGVLKDCQSENDVCLKENIRDQWEMNQEKFKDPVIREEYIPQFVNVDLDCEEYAIVETENRQKVKSGNNIIVMWENEWTMIVDLASYKTLDEMINNWQEKRQEEKYGLIKLFRVFLDSCVKCENQVNVTREEVETCCSIYEKTLTKCTNCGIIYHESK